MNVDVGSLIGPLNTLKKKILPINKTIIRTFGDLIILRKWDYNTGQKLMEPVADILQIFPDGVIGYFHLFMGQSNRDWS